VFVHRRNRKKFFISTQSFFFLTAAWLLPIFSSNRDSFVPEFESERGKFVQFMREKELFFDSRDALIFS
jgi:hypothetical protein